MPASAVTLRPETRQSSTDEVCELSVSLFGQIAVRAGGHALDIRSRKSRALLAYIALNESGVESRERLVGLLWSESPEEKARASLRQSLHELRTTFDAVGFRGFRAEKLTISLNTAA